MVWEPDDDLGLVVGERYELARVLGTGSSSGVFEARDLHLRRRVAVKMLHGVHLTEPEYLARFLREMRSMSNLRHPGIVTFLDAGEAPDGRPFIVQELLLGEDMQTVLEAGSLGIAHVYEVSLQILDALVSVHRHGLVHRDVKPSNVFLLYDEFGGVRAKLVDFGIAKPVVGTSTAVTRSGHTVGTPEYMSPEQARGGTVSPVSDVWSVGALMHDALTGSPPFEGTSPMEVMIAVLTKVRPTVSSKRPDLPEWLGHIVDRALEREPEDRWPSAASMRDALRDGVASQRADGPRRSRTLG